MEYLNEYYTKVHLENASYVTGSDEIQKTERLVDFNESEGVPA
jgi:hypothetical protein